MIYNNDCVFFISILFSLSVNKISNCMNTMSEMDYIFIFIHIFFTTTGHLFLLSHLVSIKLLAKGMMPLIFHF